VEKCRDHQREADRQQPFQVSVAPQWRELHRR